MATNKVFCSYQEVIDLHTESNKVSVVGIHTPTGDIPKQMFSGFYKQFRKMRYLGCSLAMVPAARLPADPLQVSYEAGEPTIDPRDMLNPIMFHGCHGDDMGAILNQFYQAPSVNLLSSSTVFSVDTKRASGADVSDVSVPRLGDTESNSMAVYESLYYKALTDKTWSKHHPQIGLKKSGLHPRVYELVTDRQYLPTTGGPIQGTAQNNGGISPTVSEFYNGNEEMRNLGTLGPNPVDSLASNPASRAPYVDQFRTVGAPAGFKYNSGRYYAGYSTSSQSFFTNRTVPLGWLDTYQQVASSTGLGFTPDNTASTTAGVYPAGTTKNAIAAALGSTWTAVDLPRVNMVMILLPPAYKTEQYYRLVLNHKFAFAGFRGISMQSETIDETLDVPSYFNANGDDMDVYHPDEIANRPWGSDPI